jgi:hypothetical protein
MEYFRFIDKQTTEVEIQEKITPENIDHFTETMLFLRDGNTYFNGATLWGEFKISCDKIMGGVRFTLLDCPNALSWTITTGYPPEQNKIALHSTINRTQKPDEFIEELQEFLDEWEAGLISNL